MSIYDYHHCISKQMLESRKVSFHVWALDNDTFLPSKQLKKSKKCKLWLDIMINISNLIHPRRVCWLEKCYVTTLATVTLFTLHWLSNGNRVMILYHFQGTHEFFRDHSHFFSFSNHHLCFSLFPIIWLGFIHSR